MEVNVYNIEGKVVGKERLPEEIFNVEFQPDLVYQVVVSQMANRRQGTAHTKQRGEVRGGGRKPWAQKGTGRARHGSIRSPIWVGVGVVFGPRKEKNYKKIIPKKMRRKALLMVLTAKVQSDSLRLLDELKLNQAKTKEVQNILKNLQLGAKSVLVVSPDYDKNLLTAVRNLKKVELMEARELNTLDVLRFKYVLMPKKAIAVIKNTFLRPVKR